MVPFCGFIYKCGCTFLWSGAVQHCNIYQEGVPHCPWCEAGSNWVLAPLPVLVILGGQGILLYLFSKKPSATYRRLFGLGIIAFFVLGSIMGYVFKLIYDYPYFFAR
ncbi:hypothetical protein GWO09_28370 [candidate division KSB1 bacterium]|nr:hypothetical protein [candidate division KSB1 bacterium]